MPEYIDNHLLISSVKKTNYDAQMPEACQTHPVRETYNQKMETELLATERSNSGKFEKHVNHLDAEMLTGENLREEFQAKTTAQVKLSEKETEIYTDKSVAEVVLPELVCFQESSCDMVKDIWVDEGLPCSNEGFLEDGIKSHKTLGEFLISDKDASNNLFKGGDGIVGFDGQVALEDKFYAEKQCESVVEEHGISFEQEKQIGDVVSKESTPETHLTTQRSDAKTVLSDSITHEEGTSDLHLSTQILHPDKSMTASGELSTENDSCKESNDSNGNSTNYERSFGIITSDIESPPPEISGREGGSENVDSQVQPRQSLTMPSLEDDDLFDGLSGSTRSLFIQHGLGESSFSSTRAVPGPISYSGQIPYSGSISLRSDSSTGSFAFPILATEWNSSPVKMAKADGKHFRKHRGWMLAFLCCRF